MKQMLKREISDGILKSLYNHQRLRYNSDLYSSFILMILGTAWWVVSAKSRRLREESRPTGVTTSPLANQMSSADACVDLLVIREKMAAHLASWTSSL